MTRKLIGCAAFVAAMGFLVLAAGPSHAAPAGDGDAAVEKTTEASKPIALTKSRKPRVHKASRKAAKVAAVKADRKVRQVAPMPVADKQIPEAVANANAQMPSADARGAAAIGETPALEAAAAEQLTELGRSLTTQPAEATRQMAQPVVPEQPQSALPLVAPEPNRPLKQARVSSSNDAWAQSSLIGKIFIAFGGMLTLASAARMLVA